MPRNTPARWLKLDTLSIQWKRISSASSVTILSVMRRFCLIVSLSNSIFWLFFSCQLALIVIFFFRCSSTWNQRRRWQQQLTNTPIRKRSCCPSENNWVAVDVWWKWWIKPHARFVTLVFSSFFSLKHFTANSGNWCNSVPPTRVDPTTHLWEAPWAGPQSGSGSASTATYGPIYNPTAPPPSANYTAIASNYSGSNLNKKYQDLIDPF